MRNTVIVDGREVRVADLPPPPDVLGFDRRAEHLEVTRIGFTLQYCESWPRPFLENGVWYPRFYQRTTLYTVERILGNTLIGTRQTGA